MKNKFAIIFLNAFIIVFVSTVSAQDKKTKSNKSEISSNQIQSLEADKDYILMAGGETYIRKNGKLIDVKNDRMIEGMRVTPQGKVYKRDGSQFSLENGQAYTMDGKIIKINESQVINDKMKSMHEQCMSMMEAGREAEQNMSMMNEKIRLLNKKTELLNQKMNLVNQQMNKSKKISKEEQNMINESMSLLDQQMRDTDVKLQQLDEEMTKK